ncbi:MAG: hypothetical protein IJ727_09210 [Treponema sp.]|nr:hypothetical protein [Treponema sp.]
MRKNNFLPGTRRFVAGIILFGGALLGASIHAETIFKPQLNFIEHRFSVTFTLPEDDGTKEKSLQGGTGLKLSFADAEVRLFASLPKTDFVEISDCESIKEASELLNSKKYGAGFCFLKDFFPTTVKVGKNTYSKSVAKMKSPAPSTTINPLAKTFSFTPGTGASLPTLSSSNTPLSFSVSNKIPPLFDSRLKISNDAYINEKKEYANVLAAKYSISKSISFQTAFSIGCFYIENNNTILKKNKLLFEPDYFFSGLGELSFQSMFLKINFFSGIQESPYEENPLWIKLETSSAFKSLLLNFSLFSIPWYENYPKAVPLIGASSTICRIIEQESINSQLYFFLDKKGNSTVRLGFSALKNKRVSNSNVPELLETAKFRSALTFENKLFNIKLDWTRGNILTAGQPPTKSSRPDEYQKYELSSSAHTGRVKNYIVFSYTNYPPKSETSKEKEIYSVVVKSWIKQQNISAQAGIDLTYKDKEISAREGSASFSYAIKKKYIRSYIRIGVIMPF